MVARHLAMVHNDTRQIETYNKTAVVRNAYREMNAFDTGILPPSLATREARCWTVDQLVSRARGSTAPHAWDHAAGAACEEIDG